MDKKFQKQALLLAIRAGEIMMRSGAEISRVEDTVARICKVCGMDYANVFAMPTGIFISIDNDNTDEAPSSYIKRITYSDTDLSKISRVNSFSREFEATDMSPAEGMRILDEISASPSYNFFIRLAAAAIVAGCFSVLFGGDASDFCCAFFIAMPAYTAYRLLERYEINFFIIGFLCTAMTALLALIASALIAEAAYAPIISGTIMLFVPGVAITNSIRDFLSGDMTSGLSRMTEAVLTAVSLAVGVGFIMQIWDSLGGGLHAA